MAPCLRMLEEQGRDSKHWDEGFLLPHSAYNRSGRGGRVHMDLGVRALKGEVGSRSCCLLSFHGSASNGRAPLLRWAGCPLHGLRVGMLSFWKSITSAQDRPTLLLFLLPFR